MSVVDKILCEIKKSVRLIDNEFSSIKKLLLILDNDAHAEFNTIIDAFSSFYVNRLTFNNNLNNDEIEIDMKTPLGTPLNTQLNVPPVDLQDESLTDPAELELKIAEEMRAIIDSRRAELEKDLSKTSYTAPIHFRETIACEPVERNKSQEKISSVSNNVNALLKLLGDSNSNMDMPTIDEETDEVIDEVICDTDEVICDKRHSLPNVMSKSFSHKVVVPPIPRVYTVPPVKFTSPDKLPESYPQVAPLFKLSLQQRNRMFEKFYKTAKLTVEELTKDLETQPNEDEKNKMIRAECDKMLEDYLAGGVDTLDQTEL